MSRDVIHGRNKWQDNQSKTRMHRRRFMDMRKEKSTGRMNEDGVEAFKKNNIAQVTTLR